MPHFCRLTSGCYVCPGKVSTPPSQRLHSLVGQLQAAAEVDLCEARAAGSESLGKGGESYQSPSPG